MNKHKIFHRLQLGWILVLFLLTSCWSYKPIEDVNFVAGAAIDRGKNGKITSTLQYILPQQSGSGNTGNAGTPKPYINVSATSDSLESIGWETTLKREGYIFGAHEKITVIGEELARKMDLEQLMDLYYRDIDIRGSTLLFISKGKASNTLEIKEPNVVPAFRIAEIANQQSTTRVIAPTTLNQTLGRLESGTSFLIQRIVSSGEDVKFDGAAVIKGKTNKLIGFFNKKEVEGFNWLTGGSKSGSLSTNHKQPIQFQVESMKSKIQPYVKGEDISFQVKIESEGRIAENWRASYSTFEEQDIKKMEKELEKEVKRLVNRTTKKMQKEYKVDVGGFGNQLRIHYPKVWEKEKKDWDQKFSKVPIEYHVNVKIQDYGMVGTKKE